MNKRSLVDLADSDGARRRVIGKSSSGGAFMIGGHFLKGWSRPQIRVTLSSAEAELIACVKYSAELLGMRSAMSNWPAESHGVVYVYYSAALAIAYRQGASKLRRISISAIWIQGQQDLRQLEMGRPWVRTAQLTS